MSRDRDEDARNDLAKQIEGLTEDPIEDLKALRKRIGRMEEGFRNQRLNRIAVVATVYAKIMISGLRRQNLIILMKMKDKESSLKGRKICRLVFRYAYGAPERGALYERARKHAYISFEVLSNGGSPTEIPDLIRGAGGVEELYASQKAKNKIGREGHGSTDGPDTGEGPSRAGASDEDDEDAEDIGDDNDGGTDDGDDGDDAGEDDVGALRRPSPPTSASGPTSGGDGRRKRPRVPFNPKTDLVVTFSSSAKLYELLGAKVRRALLEIEISSDETEAVSVSMVRWIPN